MTEVVELMEINGECELEEEVEIAAHQGLGSSGDEGEIAMLEQQELDELNDLYERQSHGEPIDAERLYELELNVKVRQGEDLSEQEFEDYDYFTKRQELLVLFSEEFVELLGKQESGEEVDNDRLYFLEIADKKLAKVNLTAEESGDLEAFVCEALGIPVENHALSEEEVLAQQVQAEVEEFNDLIERFGRGEEIDEERLYELELLERQRRGEDLTEQEKQDLAYFQEKRDNDLAYEEELILLLVMVDL